MAKISDELRQFIDDGELFPSQIDELMCIADRIDKEMVELPKDADDEYIHIGAVSGRCAPENLFRHCSVLLDLIGLDSGAEATRDYCGAMVQWHIDHIRDMEEDA